MIAGYTGTQNRATYTCVGDTVNLAARLEAHTKAVGEPILIDEATKESLDSSLVTEPKGCFRQRARRRKWSFILSRLDRAGSGLLS